jgi:hypothetical protein
MNYWTRREFEKSVDALLNLSKEIFVKNNSSRKNTCDYYLAESYYER